MFNNHTQWTEYPCYYVIAFQRFQRTWFAGPYRTHAEAQAILPHCIDWATSGSGDTAANCYTYQVAEHYNGQTRSILGEVSVQPTAPDVEADRFWRPLVTVSVCGGLIEDMEATIPVTVIIEDWDVPDEDTGTKPTRSIHTLTGAFDAGGRHD